MLSDGSIKTGRLRPCPVCFSEESREVVYRQQFHQGPLGPGYDVSICGYCGAGFADRIPEEKVFELFYTNQSKYFYWSDIRTESPYDIRRFERIADQICEILPNRAARILDVGCATGGLLGVLSCRGYSNLMGCDPSPKCVEVARSRHSITIETGRISELRDWEHRFDAILLVGVLEHLPNLMETVTTLYSLLRPEGIVYCAQPDVELFSRTVNAPFQQFSFEHINYFSKYSLSRVMASAGLAPVRCWQWLVEWRAGILDSVLSACYVKSAAGIQAMKCPVSRTSIVDYIERDRRAEYLNMEVLARLASSGERILVWGAGTMTRKLLASSPLGQCNIAAFVDSNSNLSGRLLNGVAVIAPAEACHSRQRVLIGSVAFGAEIKSEMKRIGMNNEIIMLEAAR